MTKTEVRNLNKAAMITEFGGKCNYCGDSEICCLEFHNMFNKKESLSQVWSGSKDSMRDKLKAHELVCFSCHAKVHARLLEHAPTKVPNDLAGSEDSMSESNPFKPVDNEAAKIKYAEEHDEKWIHAVQPDKNKNWMTREKAQEMKDKAYQEECTKRGDEPLEFN